MKNKIIINLVLTRFYNYLNMALQHMAYYTLSLFN